MEKVKDVVKRQIARTIEDKHIGNVVEQDVQHNSGIGSADCIPIVPKIATGTLSNERTGDKVRPRRMTMRGVVSIAPGDALGIQKDLYVRILVLAQKNVKTGAQVSSGAIDTGNLLMPNLAPPGVQSAPFSGNTIDLTLPVNTELFRVYMDKVVKLQGVATDGVEAIPRYSTRWSFTFKKSKLPATLTYDSGNGDWANNFAPFLAIGYAYCDGSTPDTTTTRVISNCFSDLFYEDA